MWAESDQELAACQADRQHVLTLFHRPRSDDVYIWGARPLCATLRRLAAEGEIGLLDLRGDDPTFALPSGPLRALVARADFELAFRDLIAPQLPQVGGHQVGDVGSLLRAAAERGAGVLFCVFEDW